MSWGSKGEKNAVLLENSGFFINAAMSCHTPLHSLSQSRSKGYAHFIEEMVRQKMDCPYAEWSRAENWFNWEKVRAPTWTLKSKQDFSPLCPIHGQYISRT